MKTVAHARELASGRSSACVGIGFFDGVHLGHQQIIRQTIADARLHQAQAVIVTFDRHPNVVVAPHRVPPLIYSLPQKLRAIQDLGVEALLLLHFDRKLSAQSGEQFICTLAGDLGRIESICVGSNFLFGKNRSGDVALLRRLGREHQFGVHGLSAVAVAGKAVSSTRIREAIQHGHLDAASQMLGRPYAVSGPVAAGDRLGHKLGFPTANLDTVGLVLPPNGVYTAQTLIDEKTFPAVLNIGHRPTVATTGSPLRFEVHILDFLGDLYHRKLEVVVGKKLREEMKFASPDALRQQIDRDIQRARLLLSPQHP